MPIIPPITPEPSNAELQVNRANTAAFIAAKPSIITLIPRNRVKTGTGTKFIDDLARPAQVGRLIEANAVAQPGEDGIQRKLQYQLLLQHGASIGLYDYWVDDEGVRWEVTGILPMNGYEVRVEVTRFGAPGQ